VTFREQRHEVGHRGITPLSGARRDELRDGGLRKFHEEPGQARDEVGQRGLEFASVIDRFAERPGADQRTSSCSRVCRSWRTST
jgi:hypothetical protein